MYQSGQDARLRLVHELCDVFPDAITQRINCELADQFTNQNVIDDPAATSLVRSDEDDEDSPPSQDDSVR